MVKHSSIKMSAGDKVYKAAVILLLTIIMILIVYPLYFVVNASISDPRAIYDNPLLLYPKGLSFNSYALAFENRDIWTGYRNSLVYLVLGTTINIVMTVMGAYPLSRKDFVGRNVLTIFYTFTMFFGGGLIPFFLVCKTLGLYNNIWVMVIPGAISVYSMIIMRTYFQSRIPRDMEEAAMIDGCSNLRLLMRIVLPLSTPILAVMVFMYGVGNWNSYFMAMIFLNNRALFPLQLILREIMISNEMNSMLKIAVDEQYSQRMLASMGLKYVIAIIATIPIFVIYPLVQKFFKEGIMVGALKG